MLVITRGHIIYIYIIYIYRFIPLCLGRNPTPACSAPPKSRCGGGACQSETVPSTSVHHNLVPTRCIPPASTSNGSWICVRWSKTAWRWGGSGSKPSKHKVLACCICAAANTLQSFIGYTFAFAVLQTFPVLPPSHSIALQVKSYSEKSCSAKPGSRAANRVVGLGKHWPRGPCKKVINFISAACKSCFMKADRQIDHRMDPSESPLGCSRVKDPPKA